MHRLTISGNSHCPFISGTRLQNIAPFALNIDNVSQFTTTLVKGSNLVNIVNG